MQDAATAGPDTIAAIATPPGAGAIGVVRISGPRAAEVGAAVAGGLPSPRQVALRAFRDAAGNLLDRGLVLVFRAPASATGEDVVELHGHGGTAVVGLVYQAALAAGARPARAGEFTERAFLNGRLDLTQAEAVADLVAAGSEHAARAAAVALQGTFGQEVRALVDDLVRVRVLVESHIDFPDEDLDALPACGPELARLEAAIARLLARARAGAALRDGAAIVIAGPPNAGKSSLLNRLARHDHAIVSPQPGTTRDLVRAAATIGGRAVELVDTAGLRDTGDAIEAEGVRRAEDALRTADHVLLLSSADAPADAALTARVGALLAPGATLTRVRSKADLDTAPASAEADVRVSVRTGEGLEALAARLAPAVDRTETDTPYTARARHVEAIERARDVLAGVPAGAAGELVAEHLRLAQLTLAEVTGDFTSDDLLGEIFATFCIGK